MTAAGLLDTSVLIASETGRPLDGSALPDAVFVSVVTLAEQNLGVLAAPDSVTRSRRLATLQAVSHIEALTIDADVARRWAELRIRLAEAGRRMNVNDLWIAAVAAAHQLPVVTQDADFGMLEEIQALQVISV